MNKKIIMQFIKPDSINEACLVSGELPPGSKHPLSLPLIKQASFPPRADRRHLPFAVCRVFPLTTLSLSGIITIGLFLPRPGVTVEIIGIGDPSYEWS
jgi:hypothetical protein